MPTCVRALFEAIDLALAGPVRYEDPLPEYRPGVYVVSQTADPDLAGALAMWRPRISLKAGAEGRARYVDSQGDIFDAVLTLEERK